MDAFLTSAAVVALAEIGDKTQLLAILLATRFKKPWPIVSGILAATVANHAIAAAVGVSAASVLDGIWLRYLIAVSFIGMGAWTLIPDSISDEEAKPARFGAFLTTVIAFFLVEMGDKTQIATVALAARFQDIVVVTMGTTLGMMLANAPAVFIGHEALKHVPLHAVRLIAAALFFGIGFWLLAQAANLL
ncbi:MAG: UPF0016 domain-containing protein [Alphaproteobacteria bacterium]|nr:UPF0016 domain-containing protein [Alphaproteobacteria bacterium]